MCVITGRRNELGGKEWIMDMEQVIAGRGRDILRFKDDKPGR